MMEGPVQTAQREVIKLAVMAVGGQGGGVLTGWIEALALAHGWQVQATAVAGVAQRTGATIYYIEMAPDGPEAPVFALAPASGDIDILIAAEWMEAGRAILRGFITPDRTTVIASTHRALAVSEKIVPGDGMATSDEVAAALDLAARDVIAFDMQTPAVAAGSVISSSLFGALAASGTLPFAAERFRDVIRGGGRGVAQSLAAFETGLAGPSPDPEVAERATPADAPTGPTNLRGVWDGLQARAEAMPDPVGAMAMRGLRKVVDFQDPGYGNLYLDRLDRVLALDRAPCTLAETAAKYIANAMTYDDVIRVADLKTRPQRRARIGAEMAVDGRAMHITEFMHPGIREITGLLPARWGDWLAAHPRLSGWIDRRINRGRQIRSDTIRGFAMLWLIAGRRKHRLGTLRHRVETAHLEEWLDLACSTAPRDYDLAVEILRCRRLIKGYSDTHDRAHSKYDRVMGALPMLEGRDDAADWLRRLREAALMDEKGAALDGALKTIASFSEEADVTAAAPAPAP